MRKRSPRSTQAGRLGETLRRCLRVKQESFSVCCSQLLALFLIFIAFQAQRDRGAETCCRICNKHTDHLLLFVPAWARSEHAPVLPAESWAGRVSPVSLRHAWEGLWRPVRPTRPPQRTAVPSLHALLDLAQAALPRPCCRWYVGPLLMFLPFLLGSGLLSLPLTLLSALVGGACRQLPCSARVRSWRVPCTEPCPCPAAQCYVALSAVPAHAPPNAPPHAPHPPPSPAAGRRHQHRMGVDLGRGLAARAELARRGRLAGPALHPHPGGIGLCGRSPGELDAAGLFLIFPNTAPPSEPAFVVDVGRRPRPNTRQCGCSQRRAGMGCRLWCPSPISPTLPASLHLAPQVRQCRRHGTATTLRRLFLTGFHGGGGGGAAGPAGTAAQQQRRQRTAGTQQERFERVTQLVQVCMIAVQFCIILFGALKSRCGWSGWLARSTLACMPGACCHVPWLYCWGLQRSQPASRGQKS